MNDECPRCSGKLKDGQALQNTIAYSDNDDFIGDKGKTGRPRMVTCSRTGPAKMVAVLKCEECGYSRTLGE